MNNKFKLTDKVTKESIRSPEFKRWLKVVLAAVCIFSLIFQFSTCVFQGLKVSAAAPGDTVVIELVPSLPATTLTDMDAVFESNGTTYYGITINSSFIVYYNSADLPTTVYSDLTWANLSLRTITISQMALAPMNWVSQNSSVVNNNSILGTWFYNGGVPTASLPSDNQYFFLDGTFSYVRNSTKFTQYDLSCIKISSSSSTPTVLTLFNGKTSVEGSWSYQTQFYSSNTYGYSYPYIGGGSNARVADYPEIATFTITAIDDSSDYSILSSFLLNYCTKVSGLEVHDFTNEIRQFNDKLTFYNTTSASWYESFSFDFEVIGVGTADTLILERDVNNYYTMSYNYNIDGVTTLQDVYSFHYPSQSGGFLRDNYKLIRFINNPDNPDFQQWLLDNTTLVGTVDDAPTFDSIYESGFNVGYNAGYEQGFANSLIGDSLSGPINALSSITLIQIGDVEITLGGVVMTAIALCLVLAFLKLYAGG